jgi:hypothetical protein
MSAGFVRRGYAVIHRFVGVVRGEAANIGIMDILTGEGLVVSGARLSLAAAVTQAVFQIINPQFVNLPRKHGFVWIPVVWIPIEAAAPRLCREVGHVRGRGMDPATAFHQFRVGSSGLSDAPESSIASSSLSSAMQMPATQNDPTHTEPSSSVYGNGSRKAPYGAGDADEGYTLTFESMAAFETWRAKEEEEKMIEFVGTTVMSRNPSRRDSKNTPSW